MRNNHIVHRKAAGSTENLFNKEIICKELNILPGQIIIDIGCGDGYMSKEFARLLNNIGIVYAIDISREAIEKLVTETQNTNIIPVHDDITEDKIDIPDASVDLIYLSTVFHIFTDEQIRKFQDEVNRLLKPGGKLAILNIDKKESAFGPPQRMRVTNDELNRIIKMEPASSIQLGDFFYMQIFEKGQQ